MATHISHGADVERLDDIAVGLRRQGTRIAEVGDRGAVLLEKLRALWEGPDFEKFAEEWRVAHRRIDEAESALRAASRHLAAESDAQRQSSSRPAGGGDSFVRTSPAPATFERVAVSGAPVTPVPPRLDRAEPITGGPAERPAFVRLDPPMLWREDPILRPGDPLTPYGEFVLDPLDVELDGDVPGEQSDGWLTTGDRGPSPRER